MEVAAQQIVRLADYPCISILFKPDGEPKKVPVYSDDFKETGFFYSKSQNAPEGTAAAQMLSNLNQNQQVKKSFPDAAIWFPNTPDWKVEKFSVAETSFRLGQYGVLSFLEINEIDTH